MSSPRESSDFHHLTVDQRIQLVEAIWDSIASEAEQVPVTEAQKQDLERRLAEYQANPKAGTTWEQLKARLQDEQLARRRIEYD